MMSDDRPDENTFPIEDFSFKREDNRLWSRRFLYEWGYFPGRLWIIGKTRTVRYRYNHCDSGLQEVYYKADEKEDDHHRLPQLTLKGKPI